MKDSFNLAISIKPECDFVILTLYTSTRLEDFSYNSVELFYSSTMAESWIGNYTSDLPDLL